MTFGEFIAFYQLTRAEGVVLRYLSDAYKALRQTVPEAHKTDELLDLIEWLGELVRQTDSSLLDEWEALTDPDRVEGEPVRPSDSSARPLSANTRVFRLLIRNAMWRRVELAARRRWNDAAALDAEAPREAEAMAAEDWQEGLEEYFAEYDEIGTGPNARGPANLIIDTQTLAAERIWLVEQILEDPDGDHDWRLFAEVDLDASDEAGELVMWVTDLDRR